MKKSLAVFASAVTFVMVMLAHHRASAQSVNIYVGPGYSHYGYGYPQYGYGYGHYPSYGYGYGHYPSYGYGYGGCRWLYRNAVVTGDPYWWDRYYACTAYDYY